MCNYKYNYNYTHIGTFTVLEKTIKCWYNDSFMSIYNKGSILNIYEQINLDMFAISQMPKKDYFYFWIHINKLYLIQNSALSGDFKIRTVNSIENLNGLYFSNSDQFIDIIRKYKNITEKTLNL